MKFLIFPLLFAALALSAVDLPPETSNSIRIVAPTTEKVAVPPLSLRKMIDAGVLMLEARAYEQFIRSFIADADRPNFERKFKTEGGEVDYAAWGVKRGKGVLVVLRSLDKALVSLEPGRVCFFNEGQKEPIMSFIAVRTMWLIENRSVCKPFVKLAPPFSVEPQR